VLTGFVSPTGQSPLKGTNPASPTNYEIGSPYTGAAACGDMSGLEIAAELYNDGPKAPYTFLGLIGYNSNSFTYTLLNQLGLLNAFGPPPGWNPGWGKLVPGL
jgi:hypothetical protein